MTTHTIRSPETWRGWFRHALVGLAGPMAVGACLGLPLGASATGVGALLLPAAVIGVILATLPAFYIGSALAGAVPTLRETVEIAAASFKDLGIVLLGMTPAFLFMASTLTSADDAAAVGTVVLFLGLGLGLRAFYTRIRDTQSRVGLNPFGLAVWACMVAVSVGLSWLIYLEVLDAVLVGGAT